MRFCLIACLLAASGLGAPNQPPTCPASEETLQRLADERDWTGIVLRTADSCTPAHAYVSFYRGVALAALGRPGEAVRALEAAVQEAPRRGRYRVELAGALFLEKQWTEARRALLPALDLPCEGCDSRYLNDFIGTLYYLEGNTHAALKYWNRIGKPVLHGVQVNPDGLLRTEVLHSALAFSPGDILTLRNLRKTTMTFEDSGLFSRHLVRLQPRADGEYDVELVTLPKPGTFAGRPLRSAVLLGRELPFQTVRLSLNNPDGSGMTWSSVVRWDQGDTRIGSVLKGPLSARLDRRFSLEIDARRESWRLSDHPPDGPAVATNRTLALGAGFSSRVNQDWRWNTGAEISWRDPGGSERPIADGAFGRGQVLEYTLGVERSLLYRPEHGFAATASAQMRTGRYWSTDTHLFGQLDAKLETRWSPHPEDDRTVVEASLHAGTTQGTVPFDKLYHLGLDRDHAVAFRAHPAKTGGVRGEGPWGAHYWLGRAGVSRRVYQRAFLSVAAGPFVDTGQVASGPISSPERRRLLVDLGIQTRVTLAYSLDVYFSLGVDVRRGSLVPFVRTTE